MADDGFRDLTPEEELKYNGAKKQATPQVDENGFRDLTPEEHAHYNGADAASAEVAQRPGIRSVADEDIKPPGSLREGAEQVVEAVGAMGIPGLSSMVRSGSGAAAMGAAGILGPDRLNPTEQRMARSGAASLYGFGQTATMGHLDEAVGAVKSGHFSGPEYERARDTERDTTKLVRGYDPDAYQGGEAVGMASQMVAGGPAVAKTALGRVAQTTAMGAGTGALMGEGYSEAKDASGVGWDALRGGTTGALVSGVLSAGSEASGWLSKKASNIFNSARESLVGANYKAPPQVAPVQAEMPPQIAPGPDTFKAPAPQLEANGPRVWNPVDNPVTSLPPRPNRVVPSGPMPPMAKTAPAKTIAVPDTTPDMQMFGRSSIEIPAAGRSAPTVELGNGAGASSAETLTNATQQIPGTHEASSRYTLQDIRPQLRTEQIPVQNGISGGAHPVQQQLDLTGIRQAMARRQQLANNSEANALYTQHANEAMASAERAADAQIQGARGPLIKKLATAGAAGAVGGGMLGSMLGPLGGGAGGVKGATLAAGAQLWKSMKDPSMRAYVARIGQSIAEAHPERAARLARLIDHGLELEKAP